MCLVIYVGCRPQVRHGHGFAHSKTDKATVTCSIVRFRLFDVAFRFLRLRICSLCSIIIETNKYQHLNETIDFVTLFIHDVRVI